MVTVHPKYLSTHLRIRSFSNSSTAIIPPKSILPSTWSISYFPDGLKIVFYSGFYFPFLLLSLSPPSFLSFPNHDSIEIQTWLWLLCAYIPFEFRTFPTYTSIIFYDGDFLKKSRMSVLYSVPHSNYFLLKSLTCLSVLPHWFQALNALYIPYLTECS